jgi:hypothetical protein
MSPLIFNMAQIHNTDLTRELKEGGKLQQLRDVIPSQLADKVVPVMEVNPKLLRRTNIVKSISSTASAGTTTIYSIPQGQTFYMTSAHISFTKDVVCDVARGRYAITCTIDGVSLSIPLEVSINTLTAESQSMALDFSHPIKVDAGTNIQVNSFTYAAGTSARCAGITGYLTSNDLA